MDREPVALYRIRLPLDAHNSDLLVVGDSFDVATGRYVHIEVPRHETGGWCRQEWDNHFDWLADRWRKTYGVWRIVPRPWITSRPADLLPWWRRLRRKVFRHPYWPQRKWRPFGPV